MRATGRWLDMTWIMGGVLWCGMWLFSQRPNFISEIELLLLFGVSVIVPLSMRLLLDPDRDGQLPLIFLRAIQFQPVVSVAIAITLFLETGTPSTMLALVWQMQTLLLAAHGLRRWFARPVVAVEELCIDAGLIYLPVSGVWLVAYSANYPLMTFDPVFVLLTAVHFTFITSGALVIMGMVGRQLFGLPVWNIYRRVAWIAVVSPALVAVGISATQLAGMLWVETVSVVIFVASFLMLTLLCFYGGMPRQTLQRVLIVLSLTAFIAAMGLALAYALGRFTGDWSLSLVQMVQWHGWLNALGFSFCGLLAWRIVLPEPQIIRAGIPFSQLDWRWRIGPDFFQRIEAIEVDGISSPTGIVDHLQHYERNNFQPDAISPAIAEFYENTAGHELLVYPEWRRGFHRMARVYKRLSARMGQMNFPLQPDTAESHITSAIVPLRDELDGREKVRGWVRVYTETQQAVYVAAYSSHVYRDQPYMNIAFPVPFGNLTSVLRLDHDVEDGLWLFSRSDREGDQGVYWSTRFFTVRLPINETIHVIPAGAIYAGYPADFPVGEILAEHKMWLFGMHCLTLHYSIRRQG